MTIPSIYDDLQKLRSQPVHADTIKWLLKIHRAI